MSGNLRRVVLVVEDEALIRMLLADCLEDSGYLVREAGTADDAIALLRLEGAVDAVVTDVRMPGTTDGIGLAAWLRENMEAVPVVVTSGNVTEHQAKAANPNALIMTKPYSPEHLVTLLGSLVGRPTP